MSFLWLAGAVVAAVHIAIALTHTGPVAVPDVSAYLSVSQWVAGVGQSSSGLQFHPGYGLLLAPVAGVVQTDGQSLHTAALMLNALAAGAVVVVAGRLALLCLAQWGGASRWLAGVGGRLTLLAVVLLAALHPSLTAASRIAWPETLLVLATLGVAACLAAGSVAGSVAGAATAAAGSETPQRWLPKHWLMAAGLLAGLSFSLHPRALVLTLALCLVTATLRWVRAFWRRVAVGLAAGWAVSIVAITITGTWPSERVQAAATTENGVEPIATTAGQIIALAAGTVGLALVGLVVGLVVWVRFLWRWLAASPDKTGPAKTNTDRASTGHKRLAEANPLAAVAIFLATGALALIVLGGWVLAGSTRADTLLYGRYIDPWAVPLAVVAICVLCYNRATRHAANKHDSADVRNSTDARSHLRVGGFTTWAISLASLTLALVVVLLAADPSTQTSARRIMTLSLSPIWSLAGTESVGSVALIAAGLAAVGVTLTAALMGVFVSTPTKALTRMPRLAVSGLVVLTALALALFSAAAVSNHDHLAEVGEVAKGQSQTTTQATQLAAELEVDCLAHSDTLPQYARWLYQLNAPQLQHEQVNLAAGEKPCSPLIVARTTIQQSCPRARQLATESRGAWGLWQLPPQSACLG